MPRSEAQNRQMRDERRAQILSTALNLFAARGLAATKITDIAAAARMSQGLLYHYFGTKEEIYVELIRVAFSGMNEAVRALEQMPLSPRDKIEKAITELVRLLTGDADFAQYFMLTAQASLSTAIPDEAAAIIRARRQAPYQAMARIMRAGQRDGSIRAHDADELAVVFWVLIKGLAMQRAAFGRKFRAPVPRLLTNFFVKESA